MCHEFWLLKRFVHLTGSSEDFAGFKKVRALDGLLPRTLKVCGQVVGMVARVGLACVAIFRPVSSKQTGA